MNISSIGSYLRRAVKLYPDFVLGTSNEVFSNTLKTTVKGRAASNMSYGKSVWQGMKQGFVAAEQDVVRLSKTEGNFFKRTWSSLKTIPSELSSAWKSAGAGKTGFAKFWSKSGGALKSLGKKMPLLGTLLLVGFELPNLFSAFKDGGLIYGLAETGKSTLRLGAGMTGAAIGQALIPLPLVGGLVGWVAGEWLMSKFTGKSHNEKKEEAKQQLEEQQAQQQAYMQQMIQNPYATTQNMTNPIAYNNPSQSVVPQMTMTPQQLEFMKQQLYGSNTGALYDDFMANASGINRLNYLG